MSCIITYKGKKYSEEQFKEYFINNKYEFATSIAKNKDVMDSFKRKMEGFKDFVDNSKNNISNIKGQNNQSVLDIVKSFNMSETGFFSKNIDLYNLEQKLKNYSNITVHETSNQRGYYLKQNNKFFNPFKNYKGHTLNTLKRTLPLSEQSKRVLEFLEKNYSRISDNIDVIETQEEFDEITKGTIYENNGGVYGVDDETGRIKILINPSQKNNETWVHELLHAFTEVILNNPQTNEEKEFVELVNKMFNEFKQMKGAKELNQGYQFNNISEFLVYSLTNTEMQDFIKNNENKKIKSTWNKILEFLKSLFGIKTQSQFEKLFQSTQKAINSSDYNIVKERILSYNNSSKGQDVNLNEFDENKSTNLNLENINLDSNVNFLSNLGKQNGILDKEVLSIPNNWTEEQNKIITQQYEFINPTRLQKKTAEKLMIMGNDLAGTTDKNYILKNGTLLNRTTSLIKEDPKFKFDNDSFNEEKFTNNKIWGNQIDDILRAVVLYRFDENKNEKIIEEILKQQSNRNENLLLSDEVIYKLISEFDKFTKIHSDKIILPQQFLYNEDNKIGGTADIILVDKYGKVEVVDLKSSVNPINWNGKHFESYTKKGEDGKIYTNNYTKTFGENRGSKKERHEAQLSMYIGMMSARNIEYNETKPIHILPVHIINNNSESESEYNYSDDMINNVTVERYDFDLLLNSNYLNKTNIDLSYEGRVLNSYQTEFEENKNKLILFVKNEKELQKRFKTKNAKYRVQDLNEILKVLENEDIANSSKLSMYILDLHKTFVSGDFALIKQINYLIKDIKNNKLNNEDTIKKLIEYKEKILLFKPLIEDLQNFYTDIHGDIGTNDPNSILYKLEELTKSFNSIDSLYNKYIYEPLADQYSKFKSSDKANSDSEKIKKRKIKNIEILENELQKKLNIPENNRTIKDNIYISYSKNKINKLKNDINKIDNKFVITKELILKQLKEGSYEDISFVQKMLLSPQSSSNVFIAGTARIIDEIFHNIRMKAIEIQNFIHESFETFAEYNKDVDRNNVKEFNKDFYETITTGYINSKTKELITSEDLALVQEIDISKFNNEKKEFLESIKNIEDTKEYWEKYNEWFLQNTENLSNKDIIIEGYVVEKGINSIIKEKQEDVKNNIITEAQYNYWYNEAFTKNKNGDRIVNYTTKQGRELRKPSLSKYTNEKWKNIQNNEHKLKFYNSLLITYLKAQDNYPDRKSNEHRYILPQINKDWLHRVSENGIKSAVKEKIQRTFSENENDNKSKYGESQLKTIPILFNDKLPLEEISLDLSQSILVFSLASQEYSARTQIEPTLKAVQMSLSENKPLKSDSKGNAIINKFAENLNLPGFDKYAKSSESNIEALFKYYIDNMVYGISQEKAVFGTPFGEIDAHSIVDTLSVVMSQTSLGLPFGLFSNLANYIQAETQTSIEAFSKQFFDTKTYLWAEKEYLSLTSDFIKDATSPINKSKIGQLIDLYDPFIGEFKDSYGRNISKSKSRILLTSSPTFFLQNLGEHHVQIKTMIAYLKSIKIKDNNGNELSLYDAYTDKDSKGNTIKLKLKDNIDLSQLGRLSDNNLLPFSTKSKLNSILQQTHGNYSKLTAPMIRKYWYGRVIEFMRRFFMTSVEKRFRQSRYNFEKEELDEGFYRTFWRLLLTETKELTNIGFGFNTSKKTDLTELEIANVRRNVMEMMFVFTTGIIIFLLSKAMKNTDDEDERKRIALILAPVMRLNAELSAFGQIGDINRGFLPDVNDISRNLTTPTVLYSYVKKTISFVEQLTKDIPSLVFDGDIQRYEKNTGYYEKGDSKLLAKFLKILGASPSKLDLTETVKAMQMQQNR